MTDLVRPDLRFFDSWAETVADFGDGDMDGSGTWQLAAPLEPTRASCASFVERVLACDVPDPVRPPTVAADRPWVRCTFSWITDGEPGSGGGEVVGFAALRHEIPGWLGEFGGHIGYSVRPSRRREGHASRALGLAVAQAAGLGIDAVLVTCRAGNDASRRTIESRGGVLEDHRGDHLRFWIETSGS